MELPAVIPGLKWLTVIVVLYGVVWLSLEGALAQVIVLAVGLTILAAGYLTQRWMGGRRLATVQWLLFAGAAGALAGLSVGLLTLAFMAVKTGLHGHGPEFAADEIKWVLGEIPLWATSGLIAGLGLGLLALAFSRRSSS